ncbi:thioredoxin-like protein CXXS1 [Heracleum sosnowskyi]|uniref:Thioredoxin-like protein CXXS1 n=1 Tax=Heracleum sosnowskyi TaxID=360622 RepID=A0AAD8MD88_9APIA|nr:thioredoxin-like protein CXXS1 [Heracleum sosnowskyi]
MEGQDQENRSKVSEVNSKETWDLYVSQATTQGSPIVVHFTAAWCMVSVLMNTYLEEYASTYPDILFLRVDVDDVKEVARKYEIKAMPTFMMIKGGVEKKMVGANPDEVKKEIEALL